jgi:hypothetical protein
MDELEQAALEIYAATGMWPNKIDITPTMWRYLKKHPLTLKRFGGKVLCAGRRRKLSARGRRANCSANRPANR